MPYRDMSYLSELLPLVILGILAFFGSRLMKSAARMMNKQQQGGEQQARPVVIKDARPESAPFAFPVHQESKTSTEAASFGSFQDRGKDWSDMTASREGGDPSWRLKAEPLQGSGRPEKPPALPAFSKNALVQAVIMKEVLDRPTGRRPAPRR